MSADVVTITKRRAWEDGPVIDGWLNVSLNGTFVGCVYQCGDVWRHNANHQITATYSHPMAAVNALFAEKGVR